MRWRKRRKQEKEIGITSKPFSSRQAVIMSRTVCSSIVTYWPSSSVPMFCVCERERERERDFWPPTNV